MGRNRWQTTVRVFFSFLMATVLVWGLVGCGNQTQASKPLSSDRASTTRRAGELSEVAPPLAIQQLGQSLEAYQPQVTILSPSNDQVFQDTTISVQLQVQDLPIFKDSKFDLGPHLHVILDNQPYQAVYDADQPIVFDDLSPGTHTLRVFASRPWHESFKNEGAYAQTTFHIFTKSADNNPDPNLPLLTYSRPKGDYGAEPIMLDFYLTNAPLHLVAQENPDDDIADWRIRVTINGESFVLDRWQPIYLQGFKPGKNWVKLEFLDENGNPVTNVFNNTVRLINYKPNGQDTLSKLVRGKLSAEAVRSIVEPGYETQPAPFPAVTPTPTPSPTEEPTPLPPVEEAPIFSPAPEQPEDLETPAPEESEPTPEPETSETPSEAPAPESETTPSVEEAPAPVIEPVPTPIEPEKSRFGKFFNRFQRPAATPSPAAEQPEVLETPAPEEPESTLEPETLETPSEAPATEEEATPEVEQAPAPVIEPVPTPIEPEKPRFGGFFNRFQRPAATPSPALEQPEVEEPESPLEPETLETPNEAPATEEEATPEVEQAPAPVIEPVPTPIEPEKPRFGGFFNRFQRPAATPSPAPEQPEVLETPAPAPAPEESEPTPEPETSVTPNEAPAPESETTPSVEEAPAPVIEPVPTPIETQKPKGGSFFNRFRRPTVVPSPSTQLPEELETPSPEPSAVPEEPETTPAPESLVIPSEPPVSTEEPTSATEPETSTEEPPSILEAVPVRPIQPEKPKADNFLKRFQRPSDSESAPNSGLPPTLPEIVEPPSLESELSPTTPEEAPIPPELPTENSSATSDSETAPDTNPEAAAQTPKLDLKEVFLTPPAPLAPKPSPRIIQPPANPASDIPSRFLKKSVPDASTEVSPTSEVPAADSSETDVPLGEENES